LTDVADGYIARRFNMATNLGRVLDPLADKLLVLSMLICFAIKQPSTIIRILVIVILAKETYMIVAGMLLYRRKFVVQSRLIGKCAAFVLNSGVFLYFFAKYETVARIADTLLVVGLILSLIAAIYYTFIVYKQTGGKLPPKEENKKGSNDELNKEIESKVEIENKE